MPPNNPRVSSFDLYSACYYVTSIFSVATIIINPSFTLFIIPAQQGCYSEQKRTSFEWKHLQEQQRRRRSGRVFDVERSNLRRRWKLWHREPSHGPVVLWRSSEFRRRPKNFVLPSIWWMRYILLTAIIRVKVSKSESRVCPLFWRWPILLVFVHFFLNALL